MPSKHAAVSSKDTADRAAPAAGAEQEQASAKQAANPRVKGTLAKGPRAAEAGIATTFLLRALRTEDLSEKQRLATQGLTRPGADDDETRALLLRQLYLVHLEREEFDEALETAEEIVDLESLGDIARQDAARAALGAGEFERALGHLGIAAEVCPPERRAFHLGTKGALLRFAGRPGDAIAVFDEAARLATGDRALYRAQLALSEVAAGREPRFSLGEIYAELERERPLKGYTLWVLGELAGLLGNPTASRDYLMRFVTRLSRAPRAKTLALAGEMAHAQALLDRLSA